MNCPDCDTRVRKTFWKSDGQATHYRLYCRKCDETWIHLEPMPTLPPAPWKPRASKMGLYTCCQRAAWLDKAIHEGTVPVPEDADFESSAYADLGTLIHDKLQTRLGCVMQPRLDTAMAPLAANAAKLFKSPEELLEVIEASVEFAASIFPKASDGKPWVAEPAGELHDLTGHLDFESQDQTEIIDLKTTSRKPDNAQMKPLHLSQLVNYWDLRGRKAKRARILYTDSLKGSWAVLTDWIDFENPFVQEHGDLMAKYRAQAMTSPSRFAVLGPHCKEGFCSYRNSKACYASLIPPGTSSTIFENKAKAKKTELEGPKVKELKLW